MLRRWLVEELIDQAEQIVDLDETIEKLIVVDGMGHVLSPSSRYWQIFADALIAHTAN